MRSRVCVSMIVEDEAAIIEDCNIRLIRRDLRARYVGVTHEYLDVGAVERPVVEGRVYLDHAAGSSRSNKFERDVRLLTEALEAEPDNGLALMGVDIAKPMEALFVEPEVYEWRLADIVAVSAQNVEWCTRAM